jgi:hypothetical protein
LRFMFGFFECDYFWWSSSVMNRLHLSQLIQDELSTMRFMQDYTIIQAKCCAIMREHCIVWLLEKYENNCLPSVCFIYHH